MNHSINICFSTTDSWISRVIRWFTRSTVSHCYITFRDQTLDRVMIMEADWLGFILIPWGSEALKGRRLVARYAVNVDEEKQIEAIRRLTRYLGTGYDFGRLLRLALGRFWRRFKNPADNTTKLICSESVVRFLNVAGVAQLSAPASWTPEEVYAYVQSRPEVFRLEELEKVD